MNLPFSQACENNKQVIMEVLQSELATSSHVLEVGSGTGQHAAHFAKHLPHLVWQTSDRIEYHSGIQQWLEMAGLANLESPITLDVRYYEWEKLQYDAVFTANSLHIMALESAQLFLSNVSRALASEGRLLVYGPFNYDGQYTSESNARFDQLLAQQNPHSAIRDFEQVDAWAHSGGLELHRDIAMPANNRLLIWKKIPGSIDAR